MRLIDADELKKQFVPFLESVEADMEQQIVDRWAYKNLEDYADEFISWLPTIDAVEVVMCKDCIHYISRTEKDGGCRDGIIKGDITSVKYNDYCSYGESK